VTRVLAILAVAFSPDGRWVVSGGQGELKVWNAVNGKLERRIGGLAGKARAIAFRPDGRMLAVATGVPGRAGAVSLIDFTGGAPARIAESQDEMLAAAFSPDGKWLAFGGTESTIGIWSIDERKLAATVEGHTGWIQGLAFSPDGKLLASGSADRTVGIWDPQTWKSILRLPLTPSDPVNAVAFSPDGDMLAYASAEHAIRVWRTQNAFTEVDTARPGRRNALYQTRAIDTGACAPLGVAWLEGPQRSRIVAACSDQTLRIVGPAGNQPMTLTGHSDWVYAVATSPDRSRIASASGDGTVRLWGPGGRLLATLAEETRP
jgi:WD40 repeat protein